MPSLEDMVLENCVQEEDGTISVPDSITEGIKMKRIFQVNGFNDTSSVVVSSRDSIVEANDKYLFFGEDQVKIVLHEKYQGVKKMLDLDNVL